MKIHQVFLTSLPLLTLSLGCSGGAAEAPPGFTADDAITASLCVQTKPIAEDGYTAILDADPAKAKLAPAVAPTAPQILSSTKKILAHLANVRGVPANLRRTELFSAKKQGQFSEPYCLFHDANKKVYGTVVLFHGFNDRPLQQAKLASYLFHSGFNVYNVHLAYHYLVPGTTNWPRTVYKPEALQANIAKLDAAKAKPEFAPIYSRIALKFAEGKAVTLADFTKDDFDKINGVLSAQPYPVSTTALTAAWTNPTSAEFNSLFKVAPVSPQPTTPAQLVAAAAAADYTAFITEARARIAEVKELGPVFLGGLSVGGTVALAAAADDGGVNVKGTMAHAPWLKSVDPGNNSQLTLVAPLDSGINTVKAGSYPMKWSNHQVEFSPASVAANLALGAWTGVNAAKLAKVPTAMIVTDAERSADNTASGQLNTGLAAAVAGKVPHVRVAYPAADKVGHALTDPENYVRENEEPDNAEHWNTRWRQLYQESFRFYTTGAISQANALQANPAVQDATLPLVRCVAGSWDRAARCSASNPK
jgi:alpha-beta hydrolase superfamily lysophospholipase